MRRLSSSDERKFDVAVIFNVDEIQSRSFENAGVSIVSTRPGDVDALETANIDGLKAVRCPADAFRACLARARSIVVIDTELSYELRRPLDRFSTTPGTRINNAAAAA